MQPNLQNCIPVTLAAAVFPVGNTQVNLNANYDHYITDIFVATIEGQPTADCLLYDANNINFHYVRIGTAAAGGVFWQHGGEGIVLQQMADIRIQVIGAPLSVYVSAMRLAPNANYIFSH